MNATSDTDPSLGPSSIFDASLRPTTVAILTVVAMSAFEGLAVTAALPQVAQSLGSVSLLPWVVTSYMLAAGVSTVATGALVDGHGVSKVFRVAVVVFVLGSLLSGIAPTMEILVGARFLQGIGAGAVNAVGLTAVGLAFPRRLVGRAFAANANVWGIMGVAGPLLAGLLLLVASWRWIFLVNLPIGLAALWMGWNAMPGPRKNAGPARVPLFDLIALFLFTGLVLFAVDSLSAVSFLAVTGAVSIGGLLLWRNHGNDNAMVLPRHTVGAPLGALGWSVALLMAGGIGVQAFLPLYVSGALGYSKVVAALTITFFVLGWTSGANIGTRVADRYGALAVVQGGSFLPPVSLGVAAIALFSYDALIPVFIGLYIAGVGIGASTNSALALLRTLVDDDEIGRATAAHQFLRNLGFAIGNAMVGAVLLGVVARETGDVELIRSVLSGDGETSVELGQVVSAAIGTGYATAAAVAAGVTLVAQVPLWALRRSIR